MSQFKNNLNMFLTSMLIVVLLGLVFMTLFFQSTINKLNEKQNEKSDEIDILTKQLQFFARQHNELNDTLIDLSLELDEYTEEFQETYNQLKNEKNEISLNLNNTKNELKKTETELKNKIQELKEIKNGIIIMNNYITQTEREMNDILKQIEDLEKDADDLRIYIDNNYDSNLTVNEYNSILRRSKNEADDLRKDARSSKNNLNELIEMIEDLKNKIEESYEIVSGY